MAFLGTRPANQVIDSSLIANGTITLAKLAADAKFDSGTTVLFQQTSAPTGWTKVTTHDNKALRVVSGAVSSGGSVDFSAAFTSQAVTGTVGTTGATTDTGTVGSTTLSVSQMPSHDHTLKFGSSGDNNLMWHRTIDNIPGASGDSSWSSTAYAGSNVMFVTGGNGSHNHSLSMNAHTHSGGAFTGNAINLAVKYVDVIIATKN